MPNFHDYFVMAPLKRGHRLPDQTRRLTSMTILSWPHWSPPPPAPEPIPANILPWLFCHGPIEAGGGRQGCYQLLKLPWLFCHGPIEALWLLMMIMTAQKLPWLFCHGPIEAVQTYSNFLVNKPDFHDYFVMAPLKRANKAVDYENIELLPWLFCHGPIEACQCQG